MEDLEINKPTRRNRKRNIIQESDDSEVNELDVVENMEDEKPS